MKVQTLHNQAKFELDRQIESIRLSENLFACKIRNQFVSPFPSFAHVAKKMSNTQQCVVDQQNFENIKKMMDFESKSVSLLTDEEIESLRCLGLSNVDVSFSERSRNIFDFLTDKTNRFGLKNICELNLQKNLILDYQGTPFPQAMYFNYINSGINETDFDLKVLFDILSNQKDLIVLRGDKYRSHIMTLEELEKYRAQHFHQAIHNIPSYNAEAGFNQSLLFFWQPYSHDFIRLAQDFKSQKGELSFGMEFLSHVLKSNLWGQDKALRHPQKRPHRAMR